MGAIVCYDDVCVCVGETAAVIERHFHLGTRIFSCFRFSKEFLKCWLFMLIGDKLLILQKCIKCWTWSVGFACSSPPIQSLSFTIINYYECQSMLEFSLFPKFYFPAVPNMFFFPLEPHVAGAIYSYFSRLPHRRSSTKIAQALGDKFFFF